MHTEGLINWLHDWLTDTKAVSKTHKGCFPSKASNTPFELHRQRAWALNLNASTFRQNWTKIILQKLIQLSKITNFNQGITECYEWQQGGQHVFFFLAKCRHSQGCVYGDTPPQHVTTWSHIWLHLNEFRSGMASLPRAGSGREKVDGCTWKHITALRSKNLHVTWYSLQLMYILGKHQKQISSRKD